MGEANEDPGDRLLVGDLAVGIDTDELVRGAIGLGDGKARGVGDEYGDRGERTLVSADDRGVYPSGVS